MLTYAEVHYRPGFVPSLIYMRQPEIVCDAPTRVEPGRPVPVFIFIKDADRYPVQIEEVVVHAVYESGAGRVARFPYHGQIVDKPIWWDSINIVPEFSGMVRITPHVVLKKGKRRVPVIVDNYRGSTKSPLSVNVPATSLPGSEGWYHGDIHCHTLYSSDQIEFGAPLEAMALAGFSMGMHWMAATDHSYDLDDSMDDYFKQDPLLLKWRVMRNIVEMLKDSFTVIPGEEVTCRTHKGRNCHMLALNSDRFIRGSGDSGDNGLRTQTECSIGEAAAECLEWGGLACAAHPKENIPFFEKLVLNRGEWSLDDLKTPGITALQIHNGVRDKGFYKGKKTWVELLLNGAKVFAFGGSDAHGDMNRRRRIGLPFLSVNETINHTFGCVRTVVRARSEKKEDICEALKSGRAVVTEGPFIDLTVSSGGSAGGPGDTVSGGTLKIKTVFQSSPEFGSLKTGVVFAGTAGEKAEHIIGSVEHFQSDFEYSFECRSENKHTIYIRAECETSSGKLCFTNPVWIQ